MITEIVTFDLRAGTTREEALALFRQTVAGWEAHPDLVRKYYLFDGATETGGGVYLWPDRATAEAAHDATWVAKAEALYGSRPRFQYFDTPIVVEGGGA